MTTQTKPITFILNDFKETSTSSSTPKNIRKSVVIPKVRPAFINTGMTFNSQGATPKSSTEFHQLNMNSLPTIIQRSSKLELSSLYSHSSTSLRQISSLDNSSTRFSRGERKLANTSILREQGRFSLKIIDTVTSPKNITVTTTRRNQEHNLRFPGTTRHGSILRDQETCYDSPKYHSILNFGPESSSMTPKSSYNTTPLLPSIDLPNVTEKDESMARFFKVQKLVAELKKDTPLPEKLIGSKHTEKFEAKENERIISLAEQILPIMNIAVRLHQARTNDSVMQVYPVENRAAIAGFYKTFIPILCQIPFSFLAKLKISVFNVCSQVELYNDNNIGVLEQKLLNGLFILKRLPSKEDVRDHLYRIVLYHFVKKRPIFYNEWKKRWNDEQIPRTLNKKHTVNAFGELLNTFQKFMSKNEQEIDEICIGRMEYLRMQLEEFDPDSFAEEEWERNHY